MTVRRRMGDPKRGQHRLCGKERHVTWRYLKHLQGWIRLKCMY